MAPEFNARSDRYAIEALIGSGAMGKVYLAIDTRLRRRVAIKVLDPGSESATDLSAAVLREARAAAAISHPNATAIYDAELVGGTAFIVMELVTGTPLRRFVGDPSVPVAKRARWLVEIAAALQAAHALGVVHRDVKPENVMVRTDGIIKVLDFGIARVPRPIDGTPHASTGGRDTIGTPAYMAPELLRGNEVDARVDQFGWGVLGYELLSGDLPWRNKTAPFSIVASVLSETPPPLPTSIHPDLAAAVMRAMAKEPSVRFASLAEAAAAIAPFAAASLHGMATIDPPQSSRDVEAPRSTGRRPRRVEPDFDALMDLEDHLALLPPGAQVSRMVTREQPSPERGEIARLLDKGRALALSRIEGSLCQPSTKAPEKGGIMATSLPTVQNPAFTARSTQEGNALRLALEGNADTGVVAELASFLGAVHATAQQAGVSEVVVDFRSLYFMTSSCFKCFITWITEIEALEERRRYTVRLLANENLHWQRRSFDALRSFAAHIVSLHD